MRDSGFATEVLTGVPNYPTGQVAHGYKAREMRTEELEGFIVHRSPLIPGHDGRAGLRIANYLSWAVSATVTGLRYLRRADVSLVYSSPATAALPALVARWIFHTPYVLLVQDVWPDSLFASGFMNVGSARPAHRLVSAFVNATYRYASHVAVISPGMVDLLHERGVPMRKLSVLLNASDEPAAVNDNPVDRARWGLDQRDFILMYAGNHGAAQNLGTLIDGLARVTATSRMHLVMVGDGVEKNHLKELAQAVAPGRVHFEDAVPRAELHRFTASADAQVVSLSDRPLFSVTMPSKVQSALASGQPVFAVANGDVRAVVLESGGGVVAKAGSAESVAEELMSLNATPVEQRLAMAARGKAYYQTHMSAEAAQRRLGAILSSAAKKPAGHRRISLNNRSRHLDD